ncbi:MAG: hypothetical protein AB7S78_01570 [Candidatus Omnitrophota bacterium]
MKKILYLCFLLLYVNQAFADEQWAREERTSKFGRLLAEGQGYKVYSPDAEWNGEAAACPARFTRLPVMTSQERDSTQERKWAYQKEHTKPLYEQWQKFMDENQEHMRQLPKMLYQHKTITREEYQTVLDDLMQEQKDSKEWLDKEYKRVEIESEQYVSESNPVFNLYIEHDVSDPQATIIPLTNGVPDADFIAGLNETLKPFLNRCGNLEGVLVHHFYKDEYELDTERHWRPERGIIIYSYQLRSGTLEVIPPRRSADNSVFFNYDPKQNKDLTLAGFIEHKNDVLYVNAAHRRDHYSLQTRQPGVVYKYDEFWAKYKDFELPRRIFDGDFKLYADNEKFKMYFNSYAEIFSTRCKDYVKEFKKYLIPSSEKISTTYYMDGHQESQYRDTYEEVYIDKRFTPQWNDYRPAVFKYFFAKSMNDMMHNEKKYTDMGVKDFKDKINATMENNEAYQLGKFFKDHPCDCATITQLGENLVRAANGLPSLQEEGLVLAGAAQESDPPGPVPAKYLPPPKPEKIISRDIPREPKVKTAAPPMDTAAWERLMNAQTKRAQYIESKLTGNAPNTFSTRLKEDPYQERFDAILKMKDKPVSKNAPVSAPGDRQQESTTQDPYARRRGETRGTAQRETSVNPKTTLIQEMNEAYKELMADIKADYEPKIIKTRSDQERQSLQEEFRRIQQKYSQKFQHTIMMLQQTR